jgi:uncharacterized protein YcbK (DUF882 family)
MLTLAHFDYLPNFKPHEFDSKGAGGKGTWVNMDFGFLIKLQAIRWAVGKAFNITSAYRDPAHNKRIGGSPRSAHVLGLAVDISRENLSKKDCEALIDMAHKCGIQGIGVAKGFIHIDMSRVGKRSWRYVGKKTEAITVGEEKKWL